MNPRRLRLAAWHIEAYAADLALAHQLSTGKWGASPEDRKAKADHIELCSLARELREHARTRLAAVTVKAAGPEGRCDVPL